jgi:hypothetical protein
VSLKEGCLRKATVTVLTLVCSQDMFVGLLHTAVAGWFKPLMVVGRFCTRNSRSSCGMHYHAILQPLAKGCSVSAHPCVQAPLVSSSTGAFLGVPHPNTPARCTSPHTFPSPLFQHITHAVLEQGRQPYATCCFVHPSSIEVMHMGGWRLPHITGSRQSRHACVLGVAAC